MPPRLSARPSARRSARLCAALAALACRRPRSTALLALLLALAAGLHVARHAAIDTDVSKMFPDHLDWRRAERGLADAFPGRDGLVAVVLDAPAADVAERGAAALAAALAARPEILAVTRPDADPFFARHGLLFREPAALEATLARIIAAQPLLGTLAADPTVRGLTGALDLVLTGVARGDATPDVLAAPLTGLANVAGAAAAGRVAPLDWGRLFTGEAPGPLELRRFVLVRPRLDFASLSPGAAATAAVRAEADRLGLPGLRVRLTGDVPMADEEFASVAEGAGLTLAVSIGLVALLLRRALGSWRLIAPVLATLLAGLALTAAFGVLTVGAFNLLSASFAVLFVGLGVDFGIQFAVRARAERHAAGPAGTVEAALAAAAHGVGPGIGVAALATATGFYALVPTDYRGISELGLIAGTGMLLAGLLSLTLLPALLTLTRPGGEAEAVGYARLAPLDAWLARRARAVSAGVGLLALAGLAALPALVFDADPLNLRRAGSEAVSTYRELLRDPLTTPGTLSALAPDAAAAAALAVRLDALPEVARTMTLAGFVPADQEAKLALIGDAAALLGPTLDAVPAPAPGDAATAAALATLAGRLGAVPPGPAAADAARLAAALRVLAEGPPAGRAALAAALEPGLAVTLAGLRAALEAGPVTPADLPGTLVRDWVAADGRVRVEAFPAAAPDDPAGTDRFVAAVRAVAPAASGPPASVRDASGTILRAFAGAGLLACAGVAALLALVLRDARLVILALAPLLLALVLTLATCGLVGPALNLANVVALPLLFGIGVAFDIYTVTAWAAGERAPLSAPLTRAMLFSALTTAAAFGSLALSSHPGTASMGVLLTVALAMVLATVLLALPALLHAFAGGGRGGMGAG